MIKNFFILIVVCICFSLNTHGRDRYLNYHTALIPQTNCFSKKGELKFAFSRQAYYPDTEWYKNAPFWKRAEYFGVDLWVNWALVNDSRIDLSYALTDKISLGSGFHYTHRSDLFYVGPNVYDAQYDTQFHGIAKSFTLSGGYHSSVAESLEYEVGTSILFGNGDFEFTEDIPNMYPPELSYLSYSMFTQNIVVSLSYQYKKLQLTAQLNTGYVRYYSINYAPVLSGTYTHIITPFLAHQTDYYIDPALIVNFNFRRFGWQLHTGFPYAFGESRISKPIPSIGLGVSFKILRGKGE